MKALSRVVVAILVAMCIVCGAMPAWSAESQNSEGQVVLVQEWTLFIRTTSGEPLSFAPYFILDGKSWQPTRPAKTVLPGLESGEWVNVQWTMDEREGRRRIDGIQILRSTTGTTVGSVVSSAASQLVFRPKDEPGVVTLHPIPVKVENRWVPSPDIARKLVSLTKNSIVTVDWQWDQEGHKRIVGLTIGSVAAKTVEKPAERLIIKPVENPSGGPR